MGTLHQQHRYVIYCRKSSEAEDRQVLSIESQEKELRELASRNGLSVAEVITEARSAKAPGRPRFNKLLNDLQGGRYLGVICWKLDRLARNPVDGGQLIWAIKAQDIRIVTPAQIFSQSDDNAILMYLEFGMAQKYIDDLSKNVKRGLRTKAQNGLYPTSPPLGYKAVRTARGQAHIERDPVYFEPIRDLWHRVLHRGEPPQQALAAINSRWAARSRKGTVRGGRPICRSSMYRILNNEFYAGRFEFPKGTGNFYDGVHETMIRRDEFLAVQEILKRDGRPKRARSVNFAYRGLIRCGECGATVTCEVKRQLICSRCRLKFARGSRKSCPGCDIRIARMKSPESRDYVYCHCSGRMDPNCTQKSIRLEDLEKQLLAFFKRVTVSNSVARWGESQISGDQKRDESVRETQSARIHGELSKIAESLQRLLELHTSPGNEGGMLISPAEYAGQRQKLLDEKLKLETHLAALYSPEAVASEHAKLRDVLNLATDAEKRFKTGSKIDRGTLVRELGSNLSLTDKILSIEASKPFIRLQEILNQFRPEK